MTDIKMGEVFDLPLLRYKFGGVGDNEAGILLRVSEEIDYIGNHMLVAKIEDAAAHAINSHDRLVAENEKLASYLKELVKIYEDEFDDPIPHRPDWVQDILNR